MRISRLAVIAAVLAVPSLGYGAIGGVESIVASQLPPAPSVPYNGPVAVGATIPRDGSVPTYFIPNYSHLYAYTVLNGQEVIVNRHTARIVRILSPAAAYPVYGYGYGYPGAYPGGPFGAAVAAPVAAAGALAAAPVEAAGTLAGAPPPPPVAAPAPGCQLIAGNRVCTGYTP
jgi:Protein of unknown function (DUF1236)